MASQGLYSMESVSQLASQPASQSASQPVSQSVMFLNMFIKNCTPPTCVLFQTGWISPSIVAGSILVNESYHRHHNMKAKHLTQH